MKYFLVFLGILACISFNIYQKNSFFGNWNVVDSYNLQQISLRDIALRKAVKKKIVEQKSQIIFTSDSIMIKQNDIISDKNKVSNIKKIKSDSITFDFDEHKASLKLNSDNSGILTVDKLTVFIIEK
ncbi:hypothetical protein [Chryseobacterium profundimaris]|uniref:Lipocalin-like domain-containing protein n=1 Tax=Chryseobacterium profundimaris TaxID=1387275 RepID=A0ABY1PKN7_9FLAO|nr:hypothetical protein [Chryseobacterium profundimaris]SMP35656.1 hypothetical protein SAMN06264346_12131 [Chryseobacterium profundimaris]